MQAGPLQKNLGRIRRLFHHNGPCDLPVSEITPGKFREAVLQHGAIMLRGAADPGVLLGLKAELESVFDKFSGITLEEFEKRSAVDDPVEKDFWQQLRLGHIYNTYFAQHSKNGSSFFDALKHFNLRALAAEAFPEYAFADSSVTNCRRIDPLEKSNAAMWDAPIHYHVDAQYFPDHYFSVNFWTPLTPCGRHAPGLQVVISPVEETKRYMKYNPEGYPKIATDFAYTHKFDREANLEARILDFFGEESFFAPEFEVGDILVISNYTLHRTFQHPDMTEQRLSLEVRLDGTRIPDSN